MTRVEQRYRRLLRVLPADYRDAWEEDMVATFLAGQAPDDPDDAEFAAEHGRPDRAEVVSVLALAVRLRLGGAGAPLRWVVRADALRRIALAALLLHAVLALIGDAALVWNALVTQQRPGADPSVTPDAWGWAVGVLELAWVAAYLALVTGHRRAAQALACVALIVPVLSYLTMMIDTRGDFLLSGTYGLLLDVVPVVALAAFHREAPPVRVRPWLLALPAGVVVLATLFRLAATAGPRWLVDGPAVLSAVVVVAGCAHLLAPVVSRRGRVAAWSVALAVLAVATLGLQALTLLDAQRNADPGPELHALLVAGAATAAVLLAVSVALILVARKDLRLLDAEQVRAGQDNTAAVGPG